MKMKSLIISLLIILASIFIFAEDKVTEASALEMIEMEQARLEAAQTKLDECKPVLEDIEYKYDILFAEKETLVDELEELKASRGFYIVKSGDWLSKLAEYPEVYGKGNWRKWPEIYKANKKMIKDANLIYPKWKLIIPRN